MTITDSRALDPRVAAQEYTDEELQDLAQFNANQIPSNAVPVRTTTGGIVWVDGNDPDLIRRYQTGELTGAATEATLSGVYLRVLSPYTTSGQSDRPPARNSWYTEQVSSVITPITGKPNSPSPLNPEIRFVSATVDPTNTFRATEVRQMYSTGISRSDVVYDVGTPLRSPMSFVDGMLVVRNNTTNTLLQVSIQLPSYITTSSSLQFTLQQDMKFVVRLSANLLEAQKAAVPLMNLFRSDAIGVTVLPINVTTPVYVRKSLPPLTV